MPPRRRRAAWASRVTSGPHLAAALWNDRAGSESSHSFRSSLPTSLTERKPPLVGGPGHSPMAGAVLLAQPMSSGNFLRRTNASLTAGKLPSPQSRIAPQGPAGVMRRAVAVSTQRRLFASPHDETKSRFLRLTKTRRWECRVRERTRKT